MHWPGNILAGWAFGWIGLLTSAMVPGWAAYTGWRRPVRAPGRRTAGGEQSRPHLVEPSGDQSDPGPGTHASSPSAIHGTMVSAYVLVR